MITAWTSHLEDQVEIERFENHIKSSRSVLERLSDILDSRLKVIDSIETSVEIYKQPGWDALLAHYNGEKASLKYIKKLITLDQRGA